MPWKGIGVAVALIVISLIALGRASSIVVDWAWFSSVGYVDVFWTVFLAKAVLFIATFAVSTLLLWINGRLALRLARPRQLRLPAALNPSFASRPGLQGTPADLLVTYGPSLLTCCVELHPPLNPIKS